MHQLPATGSSEIRIRPGQHSAVEAAIAIATTELLLLIVSKLVFFIHYRRIVKDRMDSFLKTGKVGAFKPVVKGKKSDKVKSAPQRQGVVIKKRKSISACLMLLIIVTLAIDFSGRLTKQPHID